ncbi:hypothetical protein YPPY66_0265, partial [Yersinia pestis PY-66]
MPWSPTASTASALA